MLLTKVYIRNLNFPMFSGSLSSHGRWISDIRLVSKRWRPFVGCGLVSFGALVFWDSRAAGFWGTRSPYNKKGVLELFELPFFTPVSDAGLQFVFHGSMREVCGGLLHSITYLINIFESVFQNLSIFIIKCPRLYTALLGIQITTPRR